MNYKDCLERFKTLITPTPSTTSGVKFIFYGTYDKGFIKPQIKLTPLKKWHYKDHEYYIAPGFSDNFAYVYEMSDLRVLVGLKNIEDHDAFNSITLANPRNTKDMIYNVEIKEIKNAHTLDAYVGSHIDFSISPLKNGDILCKTHFTF